MLVCLTFGSVITFIIYFYLYLFIYLLMKEPVWSVSIKDVISLYPLRIAKGWHYFFQSSSIDLKVRANAPTTTPLLLTFILDPRSSLVSLDMLELILEGRKTSWNCCRKYRFTVRKVTGRTRVRSQTHASRSSHWNWKVDITVSQHAQERFKLFFSEPPIIPWAMAQVKNWT